MNDITIQDPYSTDRPNDLADFWNEVLKLAYFARGRGRSVAAFGYTDEGIACYIKSDPLRSIAERYVSNSDPRIVASRKKHPAKVAHVDRLVIRANACKTIAEAKAITNEALRLLYGRNVELWFPGPEFDPESVAFKAE